MQRKKINFRKNMGAFFLIPLVIAIIAGIISSGIVLEWQYLHKPTPNIIVIFSPGTEYPNLPVEYKNFYITVLNNGTAQSNYVTFFIKTPESMGGINYNWGMYIHNASVKKVAYSCEAEIFHNNTIQIALANLGPEQSCTINVSISLFASSQTTYEFNGTEIGNYTELVNYLSQNYTNMFNSTVPISDSKWCYIIHIEQPFDSSVPIISTNTSASGLKNVTLHYGKSEQKIHCQ